MNFDEYQKAAARTWGRGSRDLAETLEFLSAEGHTELHDAVALVGQKLDISVLGNGIAGEAGEVADEIKKFAGHGHWKEGTDLVKEIGDVLWYAAAICECLGFSLNEVAERNIAKLQKRYKEGFSTEASKARVDLQDADPA